MYPSLQGKENQKKLYPEFKWVFSRPTAGHTSHVTSQDILPWVQSWQFHQYIKGCGTRHNRYLGRAVCQSAPSCMVSTWQLADGPQIDWLSGLRHRPNALCLPLRLFPQVVCLHNSELIVVEAVSMVLRLLSKPPNC